MLLAMIRALQSLIVCHACDLVHARSPVDASARVRCVRCRAELYRTHSVSVDAAVALAVTALVLLILSNVYPLVEMQLNGSSRKTTLLGAALGLYRQGYAPISALVLLTSVLVPAFQILSLLYVLVPVRQGRRATGQNELFRALARLRPWAMSEVFMLGALVALVKLAAMAAVIPGVALFAYGTLMLTLSALTSLTPTEQLWQWVQESRR